MVNSPPPDGGGWEGALQIRHTKRKVLLQKSKISIPLFVNHNFIIRGQKVMLDSDLAKLYEVETKALKQAVRRNPERFPDDFMFKLSNKEFTDLRSQFVTSSWGGTRYTPMAFTEAGIAMLSSVLKSKRAIGVNIKIIRMFIKLRKLLTANKEILRKLDELQLKEAEHDQQIHLIFEYLDQLEQSRQEEEDFRNRKQIGFRQSE